MRVCKGTVLTVVLLLLCRVATVNGLKGTAYPHSNVVVSSIVGFGFDKQGTATVKGSATDDLVTLHGCTTSQWSDFIRNEYNKHWSYVCNENYKSFCELDGVPLSPVMLDQYRVQEEDYYQFILINCASDSSDLSRTHSESVRYEFVNEDGQQLSVGEEQVPAIYLLSTLFWGLLGLGFVMDCLVQYFATRPTLRLTWRLHGLLLVVVTIKGITALCSWLFWLLMKHTGESLPALQLLSQFLFAISESVLLLVLSLVASGWKITSPSVNVAECKSVVGALVLLLGTLFFFSIYNSGYYVLALLILYLFMLPKVVSTSSRTANILHTQGMLLLRRHIDPAEEAPRDAAAAAAALFEKSNALKKIRALCALYIVGVLGEAVVRVFISYRFDYLRYAAAEVVELMYVALLLLELRPSHATLYIILPNHFQTLLDSPFAGQDHLVERLRQFLASHHEEGAQYDTSKLLMVNLPQEAEAAHPSNMRLRIAVESGFEHLVEDVEHL